MSALVDLVSLAEGGNHEILGLFVAGDKPNAVTEAVLGEENEVNGIVNLDEFGEIRFFGFVGFVAYAHVAVADHAMILAVDAFGFGSVFHGASNTIDISGGIAGESFGVVMVKGFGFGFFGGDAFVGEEI